MLFLAQSKEKNENFGKIRNTKKSNISGIFYIENLEF